MNRSDIGSHDRCPFRSWQTDKRVGARRRAAFSEIIVMTFPSPERSG
jgi:hypothetical protein